MLSRVFGKSLFSLSKSTHPLQSSYYAIGEEVRQAFLSKTPVVALESTIITHGMRYPHNVTTAKAVESIIRDQGAVPATIAVLNGQVKVGLSDSELEYLAVNQDRCIKISRRDFPYALSRNESGGTTVSGTMVIAHQVEIPIFVTGGVGGVHREGEVTMDISADLTELGRTPVAVISSGVKSILDIEKTLEYLETQGVAVATFGSTKRFPAFYCRESEYFSPYSLNSVQYAAKFIQVMLEAKLNSGLLIAVPIPKESSLDEKVIQVAIKKGLEEAKNKNIKGKDITPFLLNQIAEITQGKSLESNIALIKNNALVGAKIAVELSKLRENHGKKESLSIFDIGRFGSVNSEHIARKKEEMDNFHVVVIGGCNLDFVVRIKDDSFKAMNLLYSLRNEEFSSLTNRRISPLKAWMCAHASSSLEKFLTMEKVGMNQPLVFHAETPLNKFVAYIDPTNKFRIEDKLSQMDGRTIAGKINQSGGGVARNIADALGKLKVNPYLISAVGDEQFGNFILDRSIPHLSRNGILRSKEFNTGCCMVLCDHKGECLTVVGDMEIHRNIPKSHIKDQEGIIAKSSLVVLDGNLSQETIEFVLRLCSELSVPVWYEPTDLVEASKPFKKKGVPYPTFISPNLGEFWEIYKTLFPDEKALPDGGKLNSLEACVERGYVMADMIENVIVTLGKEGVIVIRKGEGTDPFFSSSKTPKYIGSRGRLTHRYYKPHVISPRDIVNVSGAGDCFASGFIAAMLKGKSEEMCIESGFNCSKACLKSSKTVPDSF